MFTSILLLLVRIPFIYGTFVVNVSQSSYEVEENSNVTLEWRFPPDTVSSTHGLFILCAMISGTGDRKGKTLYQLYAGVEELESQDQQFLGRVQCETGVLLEGLMRLHLSGVRTQDSGLYHCEVNTHTDGDHAQCQVKVKASDVAANPAPTPEDPTLDFGPDCVRRIGLYLSVLIAVIIVTVTLVLLCLYCCCCCCSYQQNTDKCTTDSERYLTHSELISKLHFPEKTSSFFSDIHLLSNTICPLSSHTPTPLLLINVKRNDGRRIRGI
ncbi:uncharacterized protein LOC103389203 isoform X1 [Cynoglossus semilaevis]|uniref:uncharacterized protein LOC103389203 isoform X1 n=1 Tax=Cynoglossus semilaevis TaxID=244447 RepID=UPI0007DC8C11|nr:uncharacterized protein LOC103389203 isoform X1 [Cynoglossus semilaevis]